MKYKYSVTDGGVKNTSLAWRLGDLTDNLFHTTHRAINKILEHQNEKLNEFFNNSNVAKFVESGNWEAVFRIWKELNNYDSNVLAVFLIHQAGIDFLDNYSDEEAEKFIHKFRLTCTKVKI